MKNKLIIVVLIILVIIGVVLFFNLTSNKSITNDNNSNNTVTELYEGQNNLEELQRIAETILGKDVDVQIGEYKDGIDEEGFEEKSLKVTVKNLQVIPLNANIEVAAFYNDANENVLIRTDTKLVLNLEPEQEIQLDYFDNITLDEQKKLEKAIFKVVNIEQIWMEVQH